MNIILYIAITLAAVIGMEFMAWFSHKYIMHGFLWRWHEDHHKPHLAHGFFQKNDLFFLIYAIPSAAAYIIGLAIEGYLWLFFVGVGISIYGIIYFLVHDVYIHQRFKWFNKLNTNYTRGILRAHGAHHSKQGKEDGVSFGLLLVDKKYFKKPERKYKKVENNIENS